MTGQAEPHSNEDFRLLIQRAQEGDPEAANAVLTRLNEYARSQADRCLAGEPLVTDSASDLVQKSLYIAHRGIREFRGESENQLKAWLTQVIKRQVIDARRAKLALKRSGRIQHLSINDSKVQFQPIDPLETPRTQSLSRENHQLLRKLVEELSEEAQLVLRARMDDELTFEEIGKRLGKSESQVRRLWYKSVTQLQARFLNATGADLAEDMQDES